LIFALYSAFALHFRLNRNIYKKHAYLSPNLYKNRRFGKASILNLFKIEKNEEIFAKFPYFAWLFQKKVVSLQRILKA
jgi:hypothetical protein